MKVTHVPISPIHGGPRADDRFQGGSEPPTKTTHGAARSEDTNPAVSIQLSEDAQRHVAPAATDGRPGNSAYSPAHRARAAMETYSAYSVLGQGPFGQLVSQIARGEFTEPAGSGEGEPGPGATTDETAAGETTPDGATEPGAALPDEPEVVADEPEIAAGDEPAAEGETVAAGDEPAAEGETVAAGDEPAAEGETVVAGDEPAADGETVVAAGATESLAAAVIVDNAAAIEAELIDELLEETTAE